MRRSARHTASLGRQASGISIPLIAADDLHRSAIRTYNTADMNPTIAQLQAQLRELLAAPAAPDAAIEDCYLRLVAPRAWSLAERGYAETGRGAVVFDIRGGGWRTALRSPIDTYYAPEALLAEAADAAELDPLIEVAVGRYDPRHEWVAVVLYPTRVSCSRLSRIDLVA